MKEYMKPEIELIKFGTEEITDFGSGEGEPGSNTFTEDGWGS